MYQLHSRQHDFKHLNRPNGSGGFVLREKVASVQGAELRKITATTRHGRLAYGIMTGSGRRVLKANGSF